MNSTLAPLTLCLATCLLVVGPAWLPTHADDKTPQWGYTSATLSVPQVRQKLEAAGYRHIDKIQLKRDSYEVRTTGQNGERIKLHVNAQTGSILGQRDAHEVDDDDHHASGMLQKLMGNCNERRCRDDLVSAPGAAKPTKP